MEKKKLKILCNFEMIFQLKCLKENIYFARRVAFNNFEKKKFF